MDQGDKKNLCNRLNILDSSNDYKLPARIPFQVNPLHHSLVVRGGSENYAHVRTVFRFFQQWIAGTWITYMLGFGVVLYSVFYALDLETSQPNPRPAVISVLLMMLTLAGFFHFGGGAAAGKLTRAKLAHVPRGGALERKIYKDVLRGFAMQGNCPKAVTESIMQMSEDMDIRLDQRFLTGRLKLPTLYESGNVRDLMLSASENDIAFVGFTAWYTLWDFLKVAESLTSESAAGSAPANTTSSINLGGDPTTQAMTTGIPSADQAFPSPAETISSRGTRIMVAGAASAGTFVLGNFTHKVVEHRIRHKIAINKLRSVKSQLLTQIMQSKDIISQNPNSEDSVRILDTFVQELMKIDMVLAAYENAVTINQESALLDLKKYFAAFTSLENAIDVAGRMCSMVPVAAYLAFARSSYGSEHGTKQAAYLGEIILIMLGWWWRRAISSVITAPLRAMDIMLHRVFSKQKAGVLATADDGDGEAALDGIKYQKSTLENIPEDYKGLIHSLERAQTPKAFLNLVSTFALQNKGNQVEQKVFHSMIESLDSAKRDLQTSYSEEDMEATLTEIKNKLKPA
ncbi:hypothetical protein [Pelagibaculum spongiae]|uniref:Uncharacterized protein n=1 Tax=Pelagibaculum spongiae TaxID=2080658 RepID=A0A2V1GSB1_9GAMM|nr:hypothetical protein [Pelagibaculum spongiae]PVZ68182.1 hypothetical protein DC094_12840 [Pelagibaculum spongiae]